ncbi:MAG: DNA gyrase inhibitor YacG [Steroidobacteraceae bacterium]
MSARVKCPTCGRSTEWSERSLFRPFCSERCKLIDLGAWFTEQRSVAADSPPDPSAGGAPTDDPQGG